MGSEEKMVRIGKKREIGGGANGRVFLLPLCGIQSTLLLKVRQGLLQLLLIFPLFFTSFFRVDKYTDKNKQYTQNSNACFPYKWEFFKKITCQPNYENCFSKVSCSFSYKLYLVFAQYLHQKRIYHALQYLSRAIFSVIADVSIAIDKALGSLSEEEGVGVVEVLVMLK